MLNEDKKRTVKYSKSEDITEASFRYVKKMRTCILISRDLVYFATIVGTINISSCWCPWCNLSSKRWSDESHTKVMLLKIDLKKSLNDQKINEKMTSYEKKRLC